MLIIWKVNMDQFPRKPAKTASPSFHMFEIKARQLCSKKFHKIPRPVFSKSKSNDIAL